MPDFNRTKNSLQVTGTISLHGSDPAVGEGLPNGNAIIITLNSRWQLSILQKPSSTNNQFYLRFDLLAVPTLSEIHEFGNMFERKLSVTWQFSARSSRYTNGVFTASNTTTSHNFKYGREDPTKAANGSSRTFDLYGSKLFPNNAYSGVYQVDITINLIEDIHPELLPNNPPWLSFPSKFAKTLLDSTEGDVIFLVRDNDDSLRQLYAYKGVLSANSKFFESRLGPEWLTKSSRSLSSTQLASLINPHQLNSINEEGTSDDLQNRSIQQRLSERQVIHMADPEDDIDFVTLHNILYYLYTGTVNLHVGQETNILLPEGYPDEPDPFLLYRNADKFLLPYLKKRCYEHLKHGVTPENAVKRLFHKECEHHEELRTVYLEYITTNYDEVKATENWKRVFYDELEDAPISVIRYRNRLIYEISQKLVPAPVNSG